jgi:DNA-binding CsgD family transcriptional regulator
MSSQLQLGREAFARGAWQHAFDALATAHRSVPLSPADLGRLAQSAFLVGREEEYVSALQAAHQAYLRARQPVEAARSAFWIGFHFANRNEISGATGWFGRATRLLDDAGADCVERGYLLLPDAHSALAAGRADVARETARRAVAVGQRFNDRELSALAVHLEGRALLRLGEMTEGLRLLDESMVAATTGELSPAITGLLYCSVIAACREVFALRRAHEWTTALATWCERQPDLVRYAGECRVYRAEILQLHGDWAGAADEARRAAARLALGAEPRARASAAYQQAEVHRLRGEFSAAQDAYRVASRYGREPQPGLALLRLAQGDAAGASAAIRRALAETRDRLPRGRLLPAAVEIFLAAGAREDARRSCDELADVARACASDALGAIAEQHRGAMQLEEGDPAGALVSLRSAWSEWEAMRAPYEAARVRVLMGRACLSLGDAEGAALEFEAARAELSRLGAATELERLDALTRPPPSAAHGLTPRQREVLALVAKGCTNRAIADALTISEKTVARHVADIFTALGLSSRAGATAYAYEHNLLEPSA